LIVITLIIKDIIVFIVASDKPKILKLTSFAANSFVVVVLLLDLLSIN